MGERESTEDTFLETWQRASRDRWVSTPDHESTKLSSPELPVFHMSGNNVEVLKYPNDFFTTLMSEIKSANHRISMSALYIGHGKREQKLLANIRHKLDEKTKSNVSSFEFNLVVDYNRALRPLPTSIQDSGGTAANTSTSQGYDFEHIPTPVIEHLGQASVLWSHIYGEKIARKCQSGKRCNDSSHVTDKSSNSGLRTRIGLFKHPKFLSHPFFEKIPGFFRETVAVQHIKAYVMDDTVRQT